MKSCTMPPVRRPRASILSARGAVTLRPPAASAHAWGLSHRDQNARHARELAGGSTAGQAHVRAALLATGVGARAVPRSPRVAGSSFSPAITATASTPGRGATDHHQVRRPPGSVRRHHAPPGSLQVADALEALEVVDDAGDHDGRRGVGDAS